MDKKILEPVIRKAKEIGVAFWNVTFEELCDSLKDLAKGITKTHLLRVIEDYAAYCTEMGLLLTGANTFKPDSFRAGILFKLNERWHVYYQLTERGYSNHNYIGIYNRKAVRLVGHIAAIFDNMTNDKGEMQLTLVSGTDRPYFHERIKGMIADTKTEVGWDLDSDVRFFCAEQFVPTHFEKTTSGGIQGPRFWDISAQAEKTNNDGELVASF